MSDASTIQEWIEGFENFMKQKFNTRIAMLAITDKGATVDMHTIAKVVATVSGIDLSEVFSSSRKREIVNARHIAMVLAIKYTKATLKEIGKKFGGRDHTTVIHARQTITERLAVNDALATPVFYKSEKIIQTISDEKYN